MTLKNIIEKLRREYTTNNTFSTGHKRWGWSPPHFFLFTIAPVFN